MTDKQPDWQRLGTAVADRLDELGLSYSGFQRKWRVSDVTVSRVANGAGPPTRREPRKQLADGLGWTLDSFDAVARGGEPTLLDPPPQPPGGDDIDVRVRALELDNAGLKTTVQELQRFFQELEGAVQDLVAVVERLEASRSSE